MMAKRKKKGPSWDSLHPPRPRLFERLRWEDAYIKKRAKAPKAPSEPFGATKADEAKLAIQWAEYDRKKRKHEERMSQLSLEAIAASAKAVDEGRIR